ncbi:MAG: endonuclease/exonuclease/phosphatase family protein [Gammaproteobacteria bacterium]|nr:endonuclease/exonuclease/phosphatase family protein [Gammaproteobacteria bacterium]
MRVPRFRLRDKPVLGTALVAAAAVTIGASLAALGGQAWWGLELFTHFRAQYLAAQVVLFALLLTQRRLRWCFALGACAVLNAVPLVPYVPVGAAAVADAAGAAGAVEIMSVNVQARNTRHERLLEIVREASPDVVVVVEFTHRWQRLLSPLYHEYPHRLLLPEEHAFGIALLSRHPLIEADPLELETTPAIDARIDGPQGAFRLIGVHLRPPTGPALAAERNRQLAQLAELRRSIDEPLAVVGDFNVTPYSPHMADWLLETGLRDARGGRGPGFSWPTFLPILGIPIDHCIVSPEFTVVGFERLPRFGSDHYPVLARLMLERGS